MMFGVDQKDDKLCRSLRAELHFKRSSMLARLQNDLRRGWEEYDQTVLTTVSAWMQSQSLSLACVDGAAASLCQESPPLPLPSKISSPRSTWQLESIASSAMELSSPALTADAPFPNWHSPRIDVLQSGSLAAVSTDGISAAHNCEVRFEEGERVDLTLAMVVRGKRAASKVNSAASGSDNAQPSPIIIEEKTDAPGRKNSKVYSSRKVCELAGIQHVDEVGQTGLERFVKSNSFEMVSGLAILICTLVMAIEIQYAGYASGYTLGISTFDVPAAVLMPGADTAFEVLEVLFNCFFIVELVLRVTVMRLEALRSAWIWFDIILVTLTWIDWLGLFKTGLDPVMLRVLRLARMLRLLKLLRSTRMFDTLFLLIRSLQASRGALAWSFVLLWCVQFGATLVLCQLLAPYIEDENVNEDTRRRLYLYFGTFTNGMLSMFEITLANWVVICRFLNSEVSEMYSLFFILFRGCFMFAVVRVIAAVFVSETTRCAQSDDELAMQKRQKMKEQHCRKIGMVFRELDVSGDGFLDWDEFSALLSDDVLKNWLASMDIDTHDLAHLYKLLDNGDDQISLDEFVVGMSRIKGPAKSIDVLKLMSIVYSLSGKMDCLLEERGKDSNDVKRAEMKRKRAMTCML